MYRAEVFKKQRQVYVSTASNNQFCWCRPNTGFFSGPPPKKLGTKSLYILWHLEIQCCQPVLYTEHVLYLKNNYRTIQNNYRTLCMYYRWFCINRTITEPLAGSTESAFFFNGFPNFLQLCPQTTIHIAT